MNLHYTQASAGSGKTYCIENDVADKLERAELLPSEIIAVTFTTDAAEELKGRISQTLIARGKLELATGVMSARIGTVHSVFGHLLSDFAFELGLSPEQRVLDDQDKQLVLAEALDNCLSLDELKSLNELGRSEERRVGKERRGLASRHFKNHRTDADQCNASERCRGVCSSVNYQAAKSSANCGR